MSRILLLGGVRSGKSRRAGAVASALATDRGAPVCYVATGTPSDPELVERIASHQRDRPAHWRTIATRAVAATLREVPDEAIVIIEDLEGWLAEQMTAEQLWTEAEVAPWGEDGDAARARIRAAAADWWGYAGQRRGATIITAGQPGAGVIPASASVRRWVDLHGELVQLLSTEADRVELVVAGRVTRLPTEPPPLITQAPADPAPADEAVDLRDHGDQQVPPGTVDLAVNVLPGPPAWLRERITDELAGLAGYPDETAARHAAAQRHGRTPPECLPLNGAAEGFWLLAQVLRPRLAACVHPSFTEGEAALRAAGTTVTRVFREPDSWRLDPSQIPAEADLVVLGRPDNPTGMADDRSVIEALCRPGRVVVLDEAFADFLPDGEGLAATTDLPGLVVLRSLTKLWGMAGLRVGYLLAESALVSRLAAARQPWSVNSLALAALTACCQPAAEPERRDRARQVGQRREALLRELREVPGLRVWPAAANFLLLRTERRDLRERLLADGLAVRRGDTFPGLDPRYIRVAVTDEQTGHQLVRALHRHLSPAPEAS
ncbi:threonine-phosphate decarboxylase [Natronosporangium hydrolyticum]|uniref:Aminotransferase n=1 Tax=Natronosporangium hydrolyticum TaxID=2811111 RepID=A0A895YEY1_9ACTN|nr:Rv2231c family pyridoxal phosphate-dependent protein CobC [Natronosporangium hydrolyticum]QSB12770.1 threonine-phosphate decarboxylase [Natronosporangium hydrolyticum]